MRDYRIFKDAHKGETALIVANGPSLAAVPVDFLKSYTTLGCNRITAMAPLFVPTYYHCIGFDQVDSEEKRATFYPMLNSVKAAFINRLFAHHFPQDNVYSILGGRYYGAQETRFFSMDPLNITGLGATMVFVMLQVAYYMGFQKVLTIGLDHHYPEGTQRHFYDDSEFPDFGQAPGPVYDNNTAIWETHANAMFMMANEVYNDDGREIINITSNSRCPVFRQEALSDWVITDN